MNDGLSIVLVLIVAFMFGCMVGCHGDENIMKNEAVRQGAAVYTINPTNFQKEFHWNNK